MTTHHQGLRKIGEFWHYELRVNRRRVHGSTRSKDLATAKLILEERRKEALRDHCGVRNVPTFAELVQQWLLVNKAIHSQKHLREVESVSRNWILPVLGTSLINRVTTAQVQKLRSKMLEAGRSRVTVNDVLKIVKLLGRFAIKQGSTRELSFRIEFFKVQKKPRPIVPARQFQNFLSAIDGAAQNPHVAVALRVMVGLGLRESEALGMRWEWFDPSRQTYVVGKAKGKEARVLPVPDWLWRSIHAMPKTLSEWVFPAEDGKPHRAQFCKKALQRVCKALQLGNVTQHRLRAWSAHPGVPQPALHP